MASVSDYLKPRTPVIEWCRHCYGTGDAVYQPLDDGGKQIGYVKDGIPALQRCRLCQGKGRLQHWRYERGEPGSAYRKYRFTFNRIKVGYAEQVPITVIAGSEREALQVVEGLTDMESHDNWRMQLRSVEEIEP